MFKRLVVIVVLLALSLPLTASAATPVTYTSGFNIQNLSGATATIAVDFYNQDGSVAASLSDTIAGNRSKSYYPLTTVPVGFNGSAVVSSDQAVAAIANVLGNSSQRAASYGGFASGAANVSLPLVMKAYYNIDTWFNVQNAGGSNATVTVAYKPGTCTETRTIKPSAAATFDQSQNTCLPNSFSGAATITSSQPVVAVVMQVSASSLLAYNGFASTALPTRPIFPQVSSNWYGSGTGISIQNTGGSSTNVTITYYPSAGFPGRQCSETKTIAAGQKVDFAYPQLPNGCGTMMTGVSDPAHGGFVGSAKVTANSANQRLAAMVNIVTRGAANADSYGAVDGAAAGNRLSLPIVMDRNYGLFTGIAIANVGTQPTNVTCTFSGTSYTVSKTGLAPGAALTAVQLNAIGDKYVGAGVCTATGGDAKIAGIVNQAKQGTPSGSDIFTMYGAIRY